MYICLLNIVGKVIGKKGTVIQQLTTDTKTKLITIPSTNTATNTHTNTHGGYTQEVLDLLESAGIKDPLDLWQQAVLSGPAMNVLKAFEMINELVGTGRNISI